VALNEPGAVVALDEAGDGLAELVDGVVQGGPQALVLEGADPVRIQRSAQPLVSGSPRNAGLSVIPSQVSEPVKWAARYCGPQSWRSSKPRAMSASSRPSGR
jgi:hypothetical protein